MWVYLHITLLMIILLLLPIQTRILFGMWDVLHLLMNVYVALKRKVYLVFLVFYYLITHCFPKMFSKIGQVPSTWLMWAQGLSESNWYGSVCCHNWLTAHSFCCLFIKLIFGFTTLESPKVGSIHVWISEEV